MLFSLVAADLGQIREVIEYENVCAQRNLLRNYSFLLTVNAKLIPLRLMDWVVEFSFKSVSVALVLKVRWICCYYATYLILAGTHLKCKTIPILQILHRFSHGSPVNQLINFSPTITASTSCSLPPPRNCSSHPATTEMFQTKVNYNISKTKKLVSRMNFL